MIINKKRAAVPSARGRLGVTTPTARVVWEGFQAEAAQRKASRDANTPSGGKSGLRRTSCMSHSHSHPPLGQFSSVYIRGGPGTMR